MPKTPHSSRNLSRRISLNCFYPLFRFAMTSELTSHYKTFQPSPVSWGLVLFRGTHHSSPITYYLSASVCVNLWPQLGFVRVLHISSILSNVSLKENSPMRNDLSTTASV